ncbi:putative RING-H2 finger protein ATL12 isoform X1 [Spinacia oleracea]|uniref:RING-H2 finger protein ATL12 isoform X1 n=1 Tax=Spinacia oleracea TaxID=3562 RepID=A0A9R0K6U2_SPIOL|nr:putative RING-H2 finger protein ATL12 isoform X1 [Spinacia oleracea]
MIFPLLIVLISTRLANAQYHNNDQQHTPTSSNFQPSLFVVIGVLCLMFSLTLILLVYAKFFHRRPSAIHSVGLNNGNTQQGGGMFGNNTRFSGIDKAVVDSLPFFRFASLKGSKHGLQCAVCLAEFEDVEILRLLPKCKHGFHIECVDLWLEHHSTCPLCRQKVSVEDLTNNNSSRSMSMSMSMRFFIGGQKPEDNTGEESSSFELFIERESDDQRSSSSRFSIGGSFRTILSSKTEEKEEIHINLEQNDHHHHSQGKILHRLNHQIVVSDIVFKNRWSDVSSSDLMFLNSEMLGVMSSDSFPKEGGDDNPHKVDQSSLINTSPPRRSSLISADKRAMSEITTCTRFKDFMSMKNKLRQCLANSEINNNNNKSDNDNDGDYVREDLINRRKKWFPIAKRTVQWFANREKNRSQQQQQQQQQGTSQTLDV